MKVRTVSGCFWNQHLCEAIEEEIANPATRYILTFDYDSVFSADDIADEYRILETHPHIDAIVPLQSHRGDDMPLFTIRGVKEVAPGYLDQLTIPITTGHFGLTLLRADKLRQMPRPWMMATPNKDGRWGEGHTDADISFWYGWEKAGFNVHLACHIAIGHIEDVILWPSKENLTPTIQRVTDYLRSGKPMEAR
jgi:hypothetical protein